MIPNESRARFQGINTDWEIFALAKRGAGLCHWRLLCQGGGGRGSDAHQSIATLNSSSKERRGDGRRWKVKVLEEVVK
jgi:hypothetical protein